MAELTSIRTIVEEIVGRSQTWNVYRCLTCNETHAARGESRGCACGSGSAFQRAISSKAEPIPIIGIQLLESTATVR